MKTLILLLVSASAYADEVDPYGYARQYGRQPSIFAAPNDDAIQRQLYQQQWEIIRRQQEIQDTLRRQALRSDTNRLRSRLNDE